MHILSLKRPEDPKTVERFIGMIQWLAIFLPNIARIAAPISKLKSKDIKFEWNYEQESAFLAIQELVKNSRLLASPDLEKDFIIFCDASAKALGAVLCQKDENNIIRPIEFASRKLTPSEQNWHVVDQELLAVIWSLEKWYSYCAPRHTEIFTDARNIPFLFNKNQMYRGRLYRWLVRLSDFSFTIKHIRGIDNNCADYLSRDIVDIIDSPENGKNGKIIYLDDTNNIIFIFLT